VTAPLDSGGRGRPRVAADVTAALAAAGLDVRGAAVFVEEGGEEEAGEAPAAPASVSASTRPPTPRPPPRRAREVHRFTLAAPPPEGARAPAGGDNDGGSGPSGPPASPAPPPFLWTDAARRAVYDCVREALTGTPRGTGCHAGGGGRNGGAAAAATTAPAPLLGVGRPAPSAAPRRPPVHPSLRGGGSHATGAVQDVPVPLAAADLSATQALTDAIGRWGRWG